MRYNNCNVLSSANGASKNGIQIDANQIISASFHFYTGGVSDAGTIKLQASNDIFNAQYLPSNFTVTNWVDIPNQSAVIVAGAPALLTITQSSYRWIRAVWTSTSGAQSVNVNMESISV